MIQGPISERLIAELNATAVRSGIVLWLDTEGDYTVFVDELKANAPALRLPFAIHAYRGSHLGLMLALDRAEAGVTPTPLLIHMPGFNEADMRATPIFELYEAGVRYRRALPTLVTEAAVGLVPASAAEAFTAGASWTLADADAWLQGASAGNDGEGDERLRRLDPLALLEVLAESGHPELTAMVRTEPGAAAVWRYLEANLGLAATWKERVVGNRIPAPADMAFAAASWALVVEYVVDRRSPPVSPLLAPATSLAKPLVDACTRLAAALRDRTPTFYRRTALEAEALLLDEVAAARAEDLGKIDTFRFEEEAVLATALSLISAGDYAQVAAWADARLRAKPGAASFWLRDEVARTTAWALLGDAAALGLALTQAGDKPPVAKSLAAAVDAYVAKGAAVDRAHRLLEQRRNASLYPDLPHFEALRGCIETMRRRWQDWADVWAAAFNATCNAHGFLPGPALQQRQIFDDVVRPMTQDGTTAYFMVDALRYELAEALAAEIGATPATTLILRPRLAELPTITSVGMNVLAPLAQNGRLRPTISSDGRDFEGFAAGEFRVRDPETRRRAMHERVGGGTCPLLTLADVLQRDAVSLKRAIGQANLLVVHSEEIDKAGESGNGLQVYEVTLRQLKAAWTQLRDAGVRRFVITADHGFLLRGDGNAARVSYGTRRDPNRRHVLSRVAADQPAQVRVPLSTLGYDTDELQLMMPISTAVFDRGDRASDFAHGGNSPQERVIPVLSIVHRAPAGASTARYAVTATAEDGVMGLHRLRIEVHAATQQGALAFDVAREVELMLRAKEAPGVQVELCQAGGGAKIHGATLLAPVGNAFELFFRLAGPIEARVAVEVGGVGAATVIEAAHVAQRFHVSARAQVAGTEPHEAQARVVGTAAPGVAPPSSWLSSLPEGGVRHAFEHIQLYGSLTEAEAAEMLGGPRHARRFALEFEPYAAMAPFLVRVEVVGGVKRYVREGGAA